MIGIHIHIHIDSVPSTIYHTRILMIYIYTYIYTLCHILYIMFRWNLSPPPCRVQAEPGEEAYGDLAEKLGPPKAEQIDRAPF